MISGPIIKLDFIHTLIWELLAVGALQGLWKNDLVALKGVCPNCGEEVSVESMPI